MSDDDFDLSDMFADEGPKKPAKAYQQLAGLKLAGAHMQRLQLGDKDVDVPTFPYVKSLEDQVRELRKELRQAENLLQRLAKALNKANNDMRDMKFDISRKMDANDY
jgi:HPt (histidine-containing phosphotransfer) domain-containing protein